MERVSKKAYYALEALFFLHDFKDGCPWTSREITTVISMDERAKLAFIEKFPEGLSGVTSDQVRDFIRSFGYDRLEDQAIIKGVLTDLTKKVDLKSTPRGYTILPATAHISLLKVINQFADLGFTPCTLQRPTVNCPKIGKPNYCHTYLFYRYVSDSLIEILDKATIKQVAEQRWFPLAVDILRGEEK